MIYMVEGDFIDFTPFKADRTCDEIGYNISLLSLCMILLLKRKRQSRIEAKQNVVKEKRHQKPRIIVYI